ncbi:TauD/TfdA family dioxygenase [Providencia sp. PROV148]|uniref:TauD/TfdA family dioxygenase n=1 Tax=Providencia sp. PROV148 TaxID=2949858 RepID=UPI00234BA48A|nr:TauD/TfdA family dioxygenase [Providencia sp. PROV148]
MKGFKNVENCDSLENFLSLVNSLGEVIYHPNGEFYDIVIANDGTSARSGSFSQNFGYHSFPLHTDTAFWSIPAKILVMWSPKANTTPTTLLSWDDLLEKFSVYERKLINDAVFIVHTYEYTKYSSLKFITSNKKGFRYDPNIMTPANKQGKEFVSIYNKIIQQIKLTDFHWSGSNALIIDNWNMLHGRKHVENTHEDRQIFRAYVR